MLSKKSIRELHEAAESFGYRFVRLTSHQGYLFEHTVTGKRVQVSRTPRRPVRDWNNTIAALKRGARAA